MTDFTAIAQRARSDVRLFLSPVVAPGRRESSAAKTCFALVARARLAAAGIVAAAMIGAGLFGTSGVHAVSTAPAAEPTIEAGYFPAQFTNVPYVWDEVVPTF